MPKQSGFADLEYAQKKRLTRREQFLNDMEPVIPWAKLIALIERHYPKSGRQGRQPKGLEIMFRIHCMQNWFSYSDRRRKVSNAPHPYSTGNGYWGVDKIIACDFLTGFYHPICFAGGDNDSFRSNQCNQGRDKSGG